MKGETNSHYDRLTMAQKQQIQAYIFLAVPLLFYCLIRFYPAFKGLYLSLTDWNMVGKPEFIGLKNFYALWHDEQFWHVLVNTLKYLFLGMPITLVFAFTVAFFLDKIRFMHGFLRALYFLPYLSTAAAMAWVWRWLYQRPPMGILNNFLMEAGFPEQDFLLSPTQALPSILVVVIWAVMGFQVVIFLAGLRAIPESYYEAARIDGAGPFRQLFEITLPLLRPTIIFLIVMSSITFLRIFDYVYNMTKNGQGGPFDSTRTLVVNIYNAGFQSSQMGYAAAQTVVLFIMLLMITILQMSLLRNKT